MRGTRAKKLRQWAYQEHNGAMKEYKGGGFVARAGRAVRQPITLDPACCRALYQTVKKAYKSEARQ